VPVDPQLEPLVQLMNAASEVRALSDQSVEEVRAGFAAVPMTLGEPESVTLVQEHTIEVTDGEIRARLYQPHRAGPFGALVFFHGGGFVIGDLDTHDHLCRELANRADCVVVAVDYRLAPEHRFPTAVEDCWAALQWVVEEGPSMSIDTDRLAVGGDSAGGNLAAVIARRARDDGDPELRLQLLVYPFLDLGREPAWESRVRNAEGYVLTTETLDWFRAHYLGDDDGTHPDASPIAVEDLAGLPPAHVVAAEYDPLHDETIAYAEALAAAGVAVTIDDHPGAVHIFFQLGPITDIGRRAVDTAAEALRTALSS
jgi:acetyl esterase